MGIGVFMFQNMSKTYQISGDSGERLSKGRDRYICRVHILQKDKDSWSKALRVTLTLDRTKRAQEKAPVIVLNKTELDLDTRRLENQRTRQPEKPVAPGGV